MSTIYHPRNVGRFVVDDVFFLGYGRREPNDGVNLFHNMVVLDVRREFHRATREYIAMHPDFRRVETGEQIPEYVATFEAGEIHPKWTERKP
jgi:hypothetical protein